MFRDLKKTEVEVRIGDIGNGYFSLLLYKDARVDMTILDETVGAERWQRKHYECKGNLYCSVGIYFDTYWVWKDDCGSESAYDKEKGEASDSFKRACVNWGIGRELYTSPRIYVPAECKKGDKVIPYVDFTVDTLTIENKVITDLQISAYNKNTRKSEVIYAMNKKKWPNAKEKEEQENLPTREQIKKLEELKIDINRVAVFYKVLPSQLTKEQIDNAIAMKERAKNA